MEYKKSLNEITSFLQTQNNPLLSKIIPFNPQYKQQSQGIRFFLEAIQNIFGKTEGILEFIQRFTHLARTPKTLEKMSGTSLGNLYSLLVVYQRKSP